jgi:hypothetical protein
VSRGRPSAPDSARRTKLKVIVRLDAAGGREPRALAEELRADAREADRVGPRREVEDDRVVEDGDPCAVVYAGGERGVARGVRGVAVVAPDDEVVAARGDDGARREDVLDLLRASLRVGHEREARGVERLVRVVVKLDELVALAVGLRLAETAEAELADEQLALVRSRRRLRRRLRGSQ